MSTTQDDDEFPPVLPHGSIQPVLPDISSNRKYFMVTGEISFAMAMGLLKCAFPRNMVIIKQDNNDLILIHTIRLDDEGLQALDQLGTVKHIVRLAGCHGRDDPFYKHRYPHATVWAVEDTTYYKGLEFSAEHVYFTPDKFMSQGATTELPIDQAQLIVLEGKRPPKEGILVVKDKTSTTLIVGDSLQNMQDTNDPYMNFLGRNMMKLMGFIKPYNIGPAWMQAVQVSRSESLEPLLDLKFDHLLPCHGTPVVDNAWKKYEPALRGTKE